MCFNVFVVCVCVCVLVSVYEKEEGLYTITEVISQQVNVQAITNTVRNAMRKFPHILIVQIFNCISFKKKI